MAHLGEPPQRLLPLLHQSQDRSFTAGLGCLPLAADGIEQHGWFPIIQRVPEQAKIFRIQLLLAGHVLQSFYSGLQRFAIR